jgi:hypothetical protein
MCTLLMTANTALCGSANIASRPVPLASIGGVSCSACRFDYR